ncbi:hypothetical protein OI18_14410 [Flavihumibacter solisilvae]|uniref:TonB-dependent transporter Oar-like beta-barrel domain-containing protein n=2 Tax=Flavihumibacter solisilvae TaxID=1349421 RepID=A0A0C1L2D6_9BACT|nr:hypothetical protein OI18_14410 [Flavihumibacter solisilvae]
MLMKRIAGLICLLMAFSIVTLAQVTTSSMTGTVKSATGEALVGATVTAVHTPTGTEYKTVTRTSGQYSIHNMNPGGPYTITFTHVGFDNVTRTDIHLNLGESSSQDAQMRDKQSTLTEVVVAGRRNTSASGKGGTETAIGRDKIANLPSVGRNLSDYLRFTPQVKVTSTGGLSIAGQNNRYNSFMIDGAVNNDVFGLSDQGTNGGRAGAPPISIDAIDQIAVQLSPYDVSLGNFTGGGINAITRQGTNTLTGSVYYIFRNEQLTGKSPLATVNPATGKSERTRLPDFSNKTYGFRVGGPIIKNKLFFFANLEKQDDNRPQPFDTSFYVGRYLRNDSVNVLVNHLKSAYNYDPGEYINNPDQIEATRLASRIDWNINPSNQLIASYRYTKLERTNPDRSANTNIYFFNNAEYYPSITHSGSAELNTKINNSVSNKLRATVTTVKDDRAIVGNPFPEIQIRDGSGNLNFGSDISSTANLLKQDIINIFDALKVIKGKHTLTAGFDLDFNKTYNLFINRNYGFYQYANMGEFIREGAPIRYRRGYSLVDGNKIGDNSEGAAAEFKTNRLGFFVGDDIKFDNNFTLTIGLRADRTAFQDDPVTDAFFRDTAAAIIGQYYDLKGAETGKMFKPKFMFSPRIGFKYNIPEENITIRGGIGLFSGRIPLVWPGGGFQNTGVTAGAIDRQNNNGITFPDGTKVPFRSDVNNQYTASDFGVTTVIPQGELNLVAKDFKLPQVLRYSLAMDKRFGNGWTFTAEALFTHNIHEVDWTNLVFDPNTRVTTTGPDERTVYDPKIPFVDRKIALRPYLPAGNEGRNPYTSIILVSNNEDKKGFAYNFSFTIDKAFRNGWAANANYVYGSSLVKNEATSSINSSNWNNMEAVDGRNYIGRTRSDFDLGHRITAYVSRKISYLNKKMATTITLDYVGQSGSPVSYTMTGNIGQDGVDFNDLMYIPTETDLQSMVFLYQNTVPGFPSSTTDPQVIASNIAKQKELFNAFIEDDKYLSKMRGQHAERNGARLPFTNVINLGIKQDFNLTLSNKVYSFQIGYDVFNLTNMLDKDWGRQYFANFDQVQILQFAGYQSGTTTPTYRFIPQTNALGQPYQISDGTTLYNNTRWSSQISLRFNF